MSHKRLHTVQLTIRIQNQQGGFSDYTRIMLSDVTTAEKRFYDVCNEMFKAYPHVTKLKAIAEEIPTGQLLDNFEADRSDWE